MNRESTSGTRDVPAALHAAGTPERSRPGDAATDPPPKPQSVPPAPPPEPETARRPVPGVKHEPEPDAGNIMPAEDEPGTL